MNKAAKIARAMRITAYHEAGHLIAAKRLVIGYYEVQLAPPDASAIKDNREREITAHGLTSGPAFNWNVGCNHISDIRMPEDGDIIRAMIRDQGLRQMAVSMGGIVSEARIARSSFIAVVLGGGRDDWDEAGSIARFLSSSDDETKLLLTQAERVARAVFRRNWETVAALADALLRGELVDSSRPELAGIEYLGTLPL